MYFYAFVGISIKYHAKLQFAFEEPGLGDSDT